VFKIQGYRQLFWQRLTDQWFAVEDRPCRYYYWKYTD